MAAKSVLILSGIPGTVGSSSRALWRELSPLLDAPRDFLLWPFEAARIEAGEAAIVLAEGFPRAARIVALADELPTAPQRVQKASVSQRGAALARLAVAPWARSLDLRIRDIAAARESEDELDALMLGAALLRLQATGRPLSHWLVDPLVEGGILATGGVRYDRGSRVGPGSPAFSREGTG